MLAGGCMGSEVEVMRGCPRRVGVRLVLVCVCVVHGVPVLWRDVLCDVRTCAVHACGFVCVWALSLIHI